MATSILKSNHTSIGSFQITLPAGSTERGVYTFDLPSTVPVGIIKCIGTDSAATGASFHIQTVSLDGNNRTGTIVYDTKATSAVTVTLAYLHIVGG